MRGVCGGGGGVTDLHQVLQTHKHHRSDVATRRWTLLMEAEQSVEVGGACGGATGNQRWRLSAVTMLTLATRDS